MENIKEQDYHNPLGNQEDSDGVYHPDSWSNPAQMHEGDVFYQLSVNGDTPSSYFTNKETVDSCRREDGSVDFDQLRDKLQVVDGSTHKSEAKPSA